MDVKENYKHIAKIGNEEAPAERWLINALWLSEAVGIIGGPPKSCKSWMAIDMAVSVASATKCLGIFDVLHPGPSLIYLAEDNINAVKDRVSGICEKRGLKLEDLNLFVITAPSLRLDEDLDQMRLKGMIAEIKPRLVVLDPLVRLHRQDENNAKEMSILLSYFRDLQREYQTAIILVHHSTKRKHERAGLSLRGSSDLHAFGDSNLYLFKRKEAYELTVEHRSAASIEPLMLKLESHDCPVHLSVTNPLPEFEISLGDAVMAKLKANLEPVTRSALRNHLGVNNQRLGDTLTALEKDQRITHHAKGWGVARKMNVPEITL